MRCTTKDKLRLNRILAHDDIWPLISEDGTTQHDRYHGVDAYLGHPATFVLQPRQDMVFVAFPRYLHQYEVHMSMLKSARGKDGIKGAKKAIEYVWKHSRAQKLVGYIPAYNRPAIRFGQLVGFEIEGSLKKAFKKNGQMHDMVIMGMDRR